MKDIEQFIFERLKRNVDFKWLQFTCKEDFYIAGNSLNNSTPNDIDIFPSSIDQFSDIESDLNQEFDKILSKTRNSITVKHNGMTYQFCNYYHNSLKELVDSFDFSHIKIGAFIKVNEDFEDDIHSFNQFYMSEEYKNSKIIGDTEYSKSEYPLSSLIRTFKYFKRGDFSGKSYMVSVISIITDIVERGFKDYKDFKDQLDAVDLGLLPDDLELFKPWDNTLKRLYNSLTKGKNISEDEK